MLNNSKLYNDKLNDLIHTGSSLCNTKEKTGVLMNISPKQLMTSIAKPLSARYLVGELLFNLAFSNKLDFIGKYSKFWFKISDDGVTTRSAYFHLLKYGHKSIDSIRIRTINQIDQVIAKLKANEFSRQAVMHLHLVHDMVTKDEICTMSLQFMIRDNKLDMHVHMRSNDIILGIAYDASLFSMLQHMIANELDIEVGNYLHFAGSFHIYNHSIDSIDYTKLTDNTVFNLDFNKQFFKDVPTLLSIESLLRASKSICTNDYHSKECVRTELENKLVSDLAINMVKILKLHFTGQQEDRLAEINILTGGNYEIS